MGSERQIVRLMAAMILAIIAYVVPSVVQAHEGHSDCDHGKRHQAATARPPALPRAVRADVSLGLSRFAETRELRQASLDRPGPLVRSSASLRPIHAGGTCCPGTCKGSCCGTMVCCAFGILSGDAMPSMPLVRVVAPIPQDVAGPSGIGPEARRRPPRDRA